MTDRGPAPRPDLMLSAIAGGYLRNPVRSRRSTCSDCATLPRRWRNPPQGKRI